MVHIIGPQPSPVASGWSCPQCGGVWAPWVQACQNCPPRIPGGEDEHMALLRDSVLFRHSFGGAPGLRPVHIEGMRCKPACESGMCGKPDDSPVLRIPAHMAEEGGYRVARIGAGFTEIFPGLEAAVFWPADDDGKLTAHFRLTPSDGNDPGPIVVGK